MSELSVRDANPRRTIPPGPEATDGASSFAAPEVSRCGVPVTFQFFAEIPIRHKFTLSPDRAEKTKASPCGCQAGASRIQPGAADWGPSVDESFALRVASSAP